MSLVNPTLSITSPPRISLAYNPVLFECAYYNTFAEGIQLFVFLKVIDKQRSNSEVITLKQEIIGNTTVFDISEIAKSVCQNLHPDYHNVTSLYTIHEIHFFDIEIWMQFSNSEVIFSYQKFEDYIFIDGGFSDFLFKQLNYQNSSFNNEYIELHKFLTWQPDEKLISTDDIEKLFLFNNENVSALSIKAIVYKENSTEYIDLPIDYEGQYYILEINAGRSSLGIIENEDDKILYYDVYVSNDDIVFSEIRRYYIQRKYFNNKKTFVFKNSFGVFDILTTTGISEYSANVDFQENTISRQRQKSNSNFDFIQKTNSGILNHLYKNPKPKYFTELFISEEVYFVDEKNNLIPVVITSNKLNYSTDNKFINSFEFEYYLNNNNMKYSENKNFSDFADFNYDFNNDFNS